MRLTDSDIKEFISSGLITLTPSPDFSKITGITVDINLGNVFRTFITHKTSFIDLGDISSEQIDSLMSDEILVPEDGRVVLHPGQLMLGITKERLSLPTNVVGWLDGRSSLARLGLLVHVTAHRIDPGWDGNVVLEFYNAGPVPLALKPGMCIGALNFELLNKPVDTSYLKKASAKYKNQTTALSSKINND